MIGMLKLDIFFKNNISTYTINFENGKINVNQVGYAGKEFTEFLKKYKGSSLNTEMIGNIPSQDIIGLLAMNYEPEGLKELLKLTGMDGFINMYAGQMGFNIDDFVKANSGDLLVAFTDLKMTTDSFSYRDNREKNMNPSAYAKPDINYIFSVGIGDNQSFHKLIEAGKKLGNEMGSSDDKLSYNLNDKTFAIGNSQQMINQYLAGHKNKFDFTDKLSGHPIGLFVDIHKILSVLETGIPSGEADAKAIMGESLKIWNNAFFTAGEFKDDGMVANTEVNFVDQSTNSLKQLNHYFDEIAKVMIAKKEREESGSFITPPLVDTIGH
jgi:hypothetical protein